MYFVFSLFTTLSGLTLCYLLDKKTCDISTAKISETARPISLDHLNKINKYSKILAIKRVHMACVLGVFVLGFLQLPNIIAVIYYTDHHGLSEEAAGIFFSIPFIGFLASFMISPFV